MSALDEILETLARTRPVFHSEADFQHALAWHWKERSPNAVVRLEYRLPFEGERSYADLWVRDAGQTTYVELKYWTRALTVQVDDETFTLANQAAQDISRYDFIKDLCRVERVVGQGLTTRGFMAAYLHHHHDHAERPHRAHPRPHARDRARGEPR